MTKKLLMGNEAFAHAALEAGVNVVAGYPGTPSSELIETISRLRASGKAKDVYVEWSTNEKAALEVAAAAAMSGARALFTCKQVGLNVASDALMSLNYLGVRGGLVLFVADDPGPISSQTEQDTRRFAAFAKVPVLDPATPEQGFEMMKAAFDLSEQFQTPVIVRPTTRIDHASTFFEVQNKTEARPIPRGGFERNPKEWVIFPNRAYQAHGEINKRLQSIMHQFTYDPEFARFNSAFERNSLVLQHAHQMAQAAKTQHVSAAMSGSAEDAHDAVEASRANEGAAQADADGKSGPFAQNARTASAMDVTAEPGYNIGNTPTLGILTGGVSTQYALEALDLIAREAIRAGVEVPSFRFMQIGTPYPFPRRSVGRFLKDLSDVLVLEELDSVLEEELLKVAGRSFLSPSIHGKLTGEANDRGENSAEDAAFRIAYFFDRYRKNRSIVPGAQPRQPLMPQADGAQMAQFQDGYAQGVQGQMGANGHLVQEGMGAPQQLQQFSHAAGQLQPLTLERLVEHAIGPNSLISYASKLPARPPVLCAGCPHRGSFFAMKQALHKLKIPRDEAIFCGDIGCYTLGNALPLDAVDTCLCMGAGITMSQGFAITNSKKKNIAFVGDSTFFASGMTGIANAVYNNHDITVCVLDNSTTAMTGSQPHPGTGVTLMGEHNAPIQTRAVLKALGIENVFEADPLNMRAAETACEKALKDPHPNAIIFKSPCVWLEPFGYPARVHINLCTGCKKCITSIGCPAIAFDAQATGAKSDRRGQAKIDASQCNGCGLCLQVCPFNAIEIITPEEQALFDSARLSNEGKTGIAGSLSKGDSGDESNGTNFVSASEADTASESYFDAPSNDQAFYFERRDRAAKVAEDAESSPSEDASEDMDAQYAPAFAEGHVPADEQSAPADDAFEGRGAEIGDDMPAAENVAEPMEPNGALPGVQGYAGATGYAVAPNGYGDAAAIPQGQSGFAPSGQYAQYANFPQYAHLFDQNGNMIESVQPYADPQAMMQGQCPVQAQQVGAFAGTASPAASAMYLQDSAVNAQNASSVYHYSIKSTGASLLANARAYEAQDDSQIDISSAFVDEELDLVSDEDENDTAEEDAFDVLTALSNDVFLELDDEDDEDDETEEYIEDEPDDSEPAAESGSSKAEPEEDSKKEDEIPAYRQSRWGGRL